MKREFNPKVSIVIPVYNGSNYLNEAIDSALAQTYKNVEIIVINDGSNDEGKTDKICRSYGDKIRYFPKENGGVASALNMGIEKMEGEYFSWLSHDDVYYPNKVEKQVKVLSELKNRGKIILYHDYELIDEYSRFKGFVVLDHEELTRKPKYALLRCSINGITPLIPKSAFQEHGVFNENLRCTQDYDLWRRFIETYEFVHVTEIITKTRIHDMQDSNKHPNVMAEGDLLWGDIIKSISLKEKLKLEGTEYNFYKGMRDFLYKNSPYQGVLEYLDKEMLLIRDERRESVRNVKISVVIPFYNRLNPLFKSIDSVKTQIHDNWELLLIDDASTMDLSELEEYIKNDERIKILKLSKNMGPGSARNFGMKEATGEYIAFLDSDDEFLPNKLHDQLLEMVLTESNVSHTSYIRKTTKKEETINTGLLDGKVIPEIVGSCQIATPTVMIKREYIKKNGFRFKDNIRIGEDTIFWLEILRNTKLLGMNSPLTKVNVGESSAAENPQKHLEGLNNILKFLFNDKEYSKYHPQIANLCKRYYQVSREITPVKDESLIEDYSFWRNKPSNPILKAIYLFKNQGIITTLKKVVKKYSRKLFK